MSNGKPAKAQKEAGDFRRFIEESFPVKEVGEASAREKNIRQGTISTLHVWWARRPLAASRATAYAALTPYPETEEAREIKKRFIIDLCQWENSNNQTLLERARREILDANGGVPPKVLDPFSGGGSYPLEALRLGCESYANDYNPVAVLIEKATLEYPQKFKHFSDDMPNWAKSKELGDKGKRKKGKETQASLFDQSTDSKSTNPILNAVHYWGERVLEEVYNELKSFYPADTDGNVPYGYIWARTIPCQNPACINEIPLLPSYWIVNKAKKRLALYPITKGGKLSFSLVGDGYASWPKDFEADKGTISRAVATCPACGSTVDKNTLRNLFQTERDKERILVVYFQSPTRKGKFYRLATERDISIYANAEEMLSKKREALKKEWGLDPVPDEPLVRVPVAFGVINVWVYGMNNWGTLFNTRQKLFMVAMSAQIRSLYKKIILQGATPDFAKAIVTYLAITLDNFAEKNNRLNRWVENAEAIAGCFAMQALPMRWIYAEGSPFDGSVSWNELIDFKIGALFKWTSAIDGNPVVTQSSATQLTYDDNYFDSVLTDPPYYDNVPYSYLSDFFYIWLKRTLPELYPELFSTPLTPKAGEIVAYAQGDNDFEAGKRQFEVTLTKSFQEIYRVLKPSGIAVVVYAHKSTSAWETIINALLDSGLVVSGAWPISTELETRWRADEAATLASSIYIVARKLPRQPTGFYNEVRAELRQHLDTKLHRLWEEGIGGADFFIAAIGSAIEVFGKYEQVMDYEGNIVRAGRMLEEVRTIATDYAVRQILHNGFASEISGLTRLYVLWRWNYGEAIVPFDEARKLAQSCGIDISQEWSKTGFVRKEKEFIRLLGPQGRKLDDLDDPRDLIDVLHKSLLLWEKGQRAEMIQALAGRGGSATRPYGQSEAFYRVAQAISETLPNESKEKKLLDGFLAGRERVQEEVEKAAEQGRLFE
jgi:putative DNA methylase